MGKFVNIGNKIVIKIYKTFFDIMLQKMKTYPMFIGYVVLVCLKIYLFKYSSIAAAAFLPAPIARITVAAPVTASPPA